MAYYFIRTLGDDVHCATADKDPKVHGDLSYPSHPPLYLQNEFLSHIDGYSQ